MDCVNDAAGDAMVGMSGFGFDWDLVFDLAFAIVDLGLCFDAVVVVDVDFALFELGALTDAFGFGLPIADETFPGLAVVEGTEECTVPTDKLDKSVGITGLLAGRVVRRVRALCHWDKDWVLDNVSLGFNVKKISTKLAICMKFVVRI